MNSVDENDQSFRLCAKVLTSLYFKSSVKYPIRTSGWHCLKKGIAFRTEDGVKEAARKSYNEWMLRCPTTMANSNLEFYYISRGYNPSEVFVYIQDIPNDKIYLENLNINVNFVHETYNFGNVEI